MFKIKFLLAILLTFIPNTWVLAKPLNPSANLLIAAETEDTLESQVLAEINRVRVDPSGYADWLKSFWQSPEAETLEKPEGLETTLNFLRSQSPLNPVNASNQLDSVAQRILSNPSVTTTFANTSGAGSTVELLVMNLILENNEIFTSGVENQGIACASEEDESIKCVVAYLPTISSPPEVVEPEPLEPGRIVLREQGTLEEGDEIMSSDGSLYDLYPLQGSQGQSVRINLESEDFDTFLAIIDSDNQIIDQNDDIDDTNTNSVLVIVLPRDGTYYIVVNSYDSEGRGVYRLIVEER